MTLLGASKTDIFLFSIFSLSLFTIVHPLQRLRRRGGHGDEMQGQQTEIGPRENCHQIKEIDFCKINFASRTDPTVACK